MVSDLKYLFLDRDGVINRRLPGAYVSQPDDFELLPGVAESICLFNQWFDRVLVVTNQQGIGKGLMSLEDLKQVHEHMLSLLEEKGARLDGIYFCPHLASAKSLCRKPAPGMGYEAKQNFPEIDFAQSIMVGDSPSDMEFGRNLGMKVVWISSRVEGTPPPFPPDLSFPDLPSFAAFWAQERSTSVHP